MDRSIKLYGFDGVVDADDLEEFALHYGEAFP